jgi:hypothetical protein
MAYQRSQGSARAAASSGDAQGVPNASAAAAMPVLPGPGAPPPGGPALSTRETASRPFVELGIMFGQALGGREPVMQAMTNLQAIGQEHGCDAIIAVKLMHYPTTAGPAIVAYGTGVRFLPGPAAASPTEPPAPSLPRTPSPRG